MLARTAGPAKPSEMLQIMRMFDEASARARRESRTLVTIVDASEGVLPSQLNREILLDWLSDKRAEGPIGGRRIFVVAPDTLVKGFIASLRWSAGRIGRVDVVATLAEAVERARSALLSAGELVPEVLSSHSATG